MDNDHRRRALGHSWHLAVAEGTLILVWLIGIYAIIAGLIELIFAFCLWNLLREFETVVVSRA